MIPDGRWAANMTQPCLSSAMALDDWLSHNRQLSLPLTHRSSPEFKADQNRLNNDVPCDAISACGTGKLTRIMLFAFSPHY